jgi:hypothetical protein
MGDVTKDTTGAGVLAAYDAILAAGALAELAGWTRAMREEFERRGGAFSPEDPWFEARSRAFWDDAVTTQRFGLAAREHLPEELRPVAGRLARAHRGFFVVEATDARNAELTDLWSGAELVVEHLDETQALTFEHAEGPMDARVVATGSGAALVVLPGALHHPAEALDPSRRVIEAARARGMRTGDALDALLRMELVFRSSSRVKASFAYRPETLARG